MAQTLSNLSGTFEESKAAMVNGKIEELSALNEDLKGDCGLDPARQHQLQAKSEEEMEQPHSVEKILDGSSVGVVAQLEDPKGLKEIQIEDEEENI